MEMPANGQKTLARVGAHPDKMERTTKTLPRRWNGREHGHQGEALMSTSEHTPGHTDRMVATVVGIEIATADGLVLVAMGNRTALLERREAEDLLHAIAEAIATA
jgi:hypothetical protein